MSRIIIVCALAGILAVPAKAQERVSFPSTDGELKGGTPTTITGYLYKPAGSGPFAAVVGMHGCGGVLNEKGEIDLLYGNGAKSFPVQDTSFFWSIRSDLADKVIFV
jgi:hypothetical protein